MIWKFVLWIAIVYVIIAAIVYIKTNDLKKSLLWIFYLGHHIDEDHPDIYIENPSEDSEDDFPDFFDHH